MPAAVHDLPDDVTAAEIEKHLDRVALEIKVSEYGESYLCLFEYFESQLKRVRARDALLARVQARLKR